jgi:hypothetical protein
LRAVGIRSFEQPIAAGDLAGLARLVAETPAQIVVDEGLSDRDSLQRFIGQRACTGANVRISKCGGLLGAHARCREVLDAGLLLQVGCQVGESSLLSPRCGPGSGTPKAASGGICSGRTPCRRWSSSATAAVLRGGRPGPGWGFGSIRRCSSDGRSTRQRSCRYGSGRSVEGGDRCRE